MSDPNVLNYASTSPLAREERQLRLLVIFHYVSAGLIALQFPLVGLAMYVAFGRTPQGRQVVQKWFSDSASLMIYWAVFGILAVVSAKLIALRRWRWVSIVYAGLMCFLVPFGTPTGLFGIILLKRSSTKIAYRNQQSDDIIRP